jgi:hypothetical protein
MEVGKRMREIGEEILRIIKAGNRKRQRERG